jgi:hypothetical protein
MSRLFKGFINLSKCKNEAYLKKTKAGEVGVWVNVWENDEPDQWGNTMSIQLSQSKEQREAGEKKIYIGNLKPNEPAASSQPQTEADTEPANPDSISEFPY